MFSIYSFIGISALIFSIACVVFNSSDINHLKKFSKSLEFYNKHIFQDDIRCRLNFNNKHMHESLIKLGCTPKQLKSHIQGNLNLGRTRKELIAAASECVPYVGYPKVLNALDAIDELTLEAKGAD